MRTRVPWLIPFLFLAACGSDHPLSGAWQQKLPDGKVGMTLEFQTSGNKVMVHLAPRPDGGHDHIDAPVTYTWDATAKTLTVKGPLLGDGKADSWSGSVQDTAMELSSADGKLEFRRGNAVPGH